MFEILLIIAVLFIIYTLLNRNNNDENHNNENNNNDNKNNGLIQLNENKKKHSGQNINIGDISNETNVLKGETTKNTINTNNTNNNNDNSNNLLNNVIVNKNENEVKDVKQINVNLNYLETVKVNKKSNITPENQFLLALRNIPGVSVKIANNICNEYNSIDKLLSKYKKCEILKEKELLLASLKIIDG